jgi:NAD(P)H dehydrogenase (quinone)
MTITVTGATGHLGRLVIEELLDRDVPAGQIVAAVRDPQKAADLAARGVQVRHADYTKPETLAGALAGTDKLVLISSSEVGQRVAQHRNVIDAAVAAGVSQVVYTSILAADTSSVSLAVEHRTTEELILASGLPYVFLRNGWYVENYTANLAPAFEHGAILGAAGEGRVAAATRADYAAAAAAVVTGEGHTNKVYELGADEPFTLAEFAAEVSRQSGREVVYRDLPADDYRAALIGAGVPEVYASLLASADTGLAAGELTTASRDLRRLIGRPTTPLADAVALAVKS